MHERHTNKTRYFEEQAYTTEKYVIPYFEQIQGINANSTILEIGCGEGGNLMPFMNMGCKITGIDLSSGKIDKANIFFDDHSNKNNLNLICNDIYDRNDLGKFDLIILRDVIEHIPDQERFMGYVKNFMHEESLIFFGFPPWQNPFGGHQQMCKSKLLSKLPYFHLLPGFIYKGIMRILNESSGTIKGLMEIKKTGISIERFDKILKMHGYQIEKKNLFFINPNYEIKFKLKPRDQNSIIAAIPWFRNFVTTAAYYLVSNKNL